MADAFTGSNYYKRSFTEYEVEACKRDAAKRAQECNECSQTEYEVNPYDQQSETYSHIFTAATAMAAKIERRAELDAEIPALAAEIAAATEAKTKRSAELDAEITALEAEIAAAKSNRINKLAAMDAEITALEAKISAHTICFIELND